MLLLLCLALARDLPPADAPPASEEHASARAELRRLLAVVRERMPEAAREVDERTGDTGGPGEEDAEPLPLDALTIDTAPGQVPPAPEPTL